MPFAESSELSHIFRDFLNRFNLPESDVILNFIRFLISSHVFATNIERVLVFTCSFKNSLSMKSASCTSSFFEATYTIKCNLY